MFLADVTNGGAIGVLEKMLAFTEARHRLLVENVANVDTPGYRSKRLDVQAFQNSLRAALAERDKAPSAELTLRPTQEIRQDAFGRLLVTPAEEPPENVLFHDQSNMRIERQMSMLAENAIMHQASAELLRMRFDTLNRAISGRMA